MHVATMPAHTSAAAAPATRTFAPPDVLGALFRLIERAGRAEAERVGDADYKYWTSIARGL
ncbi:MAG: hypothetical protein JOZ81_33750 [Chloroflexi bacterium]|nr:hypothetical protein [Chloroflexota bacterium]MBV9547186.1 hypothetical protein [Chloroflexota bacterium]